MKILHISKFYPPYRGGIEDICYSFVLALKEKYEQKVICFNDGFNNHISDVEDLEVIRAGSFFKLASQPLSISLYFLLKKHIKSFSPDFIHLHLPNPLACVFLLDLIPDKAKLIVHWHSDIIAQKFLYKIFMPIERRILMRADRIIATSPQYLEYSIPLAPYKKKSVVIPNIISLEKMNLVCHQTSAEKIKEYYGYRNIIFFMGRHVPYKGIEYLIEAEKFIHSDCVILIAGHGPLTFDLKKITHSERIKFIGKIPDEEVSEYMKAASIFAFPSITKNEAFGVVLAEAMYCKAVPVTFTIEGSGVNWVNLNGITGIEVANRDVEAYGKAIDYLLSKSDLREKYGENARNRVLNLFTISAIKEKLFALYGNLENS